MKLTLRAVALLMSTVVYGAAHGQSSEPAASYPSKPVRVIVPLAAGGTTDVIARLAGVVFQKHFNQSLIVENRPGGGGLVGMDPVVKAPADGYTLLMNANGFVTEEATNKEWPIRALRDLTPITIIGGSGLVISISNKTPANSLRELVAYSKANPGKLNEAVLGNVSANIAIIKHRSGIGPVELVLYKGGAPGTQAVAAGEADFVGGSVTDIVPLAKAGRVKPLVYTGKTRHPQLPEVPTVNEAGVGISDYDGVSWYGLLGPAGMNSEIVEKLYRAMADLYVLPETADKMNATGQLKFSTTPAQMREAIARMKKDYEDALAAGVKLRM